MVLLFHFSFLSFSPFHNKIHCVFTFLDMTLDKYVFFLYSLHLLHPSVSFSSSVPVQSNFSVRLSFGAYKRRIKVSQEKKRESSICLSYVNELWRCTTLQTGWAQAENLCINYNIRCVNAGNIALERCGDLVKSIYEPEERDCFVLNKGQHFHYDAKIH